MTEREALKLALEALQKADRLCPVNSDAEIFVRASIAAAKEVLAQPEQEPVAWGMPSAGGGFIVDCITPEEHDRVEGGYTVPLYTTPPQRTWVGLTERERMMCRSYDIDEAILNTEAKLKEKNCDR